MFYIKSYAYLQTFLFRHFIILVFMFMINFDTSFEYDVNKWFRFLFIPIAIFTEVSIEKTTFFLIKLP